MIFCFSGTGNSRAVAETLARLTGDSVNLINDATSGSVTLGREEALGLVFPVYAWGMPRVVERFLKNMEILGGDTPYIYMVCTCGDDIGRTDRLVARTLRRKGLTLAAAWSIIMPNTYTALPGFDTDPETLAQEKLAAAKERIPTIAPLINARQRGINDVKPGAMPGVKTYVLRPLFNTFLTSPRRFRHTAACIGCRKCAAACPLQNITPQTDGRPTWGKKCTACFGCYHACPLHAVEYGRATRGKGQWQMPKNNDFTPNTQKSEISNHG